jgi:D-alanyl-D-alanine carboxypeptidase
VTGRRFARAAAAASAGLIVAIVLGGCVGTSGEPSDGATSLPVATSPAPTSTSPVPTATATATPKPSSPTASPSEKRIPDADIDDPASLAVVVNKTRPLDPKDYEAPDLVAVDVPYVYQPLLRESAADAVETMFADFTEETGLEMQSQSAYRSYSSQASVYEGWVSQLGRSAADLTSARPGFSEHQTGLAIDISAKPAKCSLDQCFASTRQGKWLAKNAWEYGFVLRYPDGLTSVTGYEFEPWHYRYIGVALARDYHESGAATLEGFFTLPDAPAY